MRDDSVLERGWARLWGAPLVALLGGLVVALIYMGWMKYDPPARSRARGAATCRQSYAVAMTGADTARVDFTIAIPGDGKSATATTTCAELRLRGEL